MNSSPDFKKILLFIVFLAGTIKLNAQENIIQNNLEDILDEIILSHDVEIDYTTLFSVLESLYYYPINLNNATKEEMEVLFFLTDFQIFSIINYRNRYGDYKTLYELQFVDGMDAISLKYLLPFVTVADGDDKQAQNIKDAFLYGRHNVITRYHRLLQEKAGYKVEDSIIQANPEKARYLGSPDKFYLRYGYQYKNKLFYGITAEKDDGEQFFKGAQKYGFDFYSAHFQINDVGFVKKIVIGDYQAQFGQGLTLWSGLSFGKTANSMDIMKKPRGVNKYSSVNEYSFFRGEAVTLEFGNFTFTEFFSFKNIDGSLESILDTIAGEEQYITNFLETGYHRTPSEVAKRKSVRETVIGGNLTWSSSIMRLGFTGMYYKYNPPFSGNEKSYAYFEFKGKENFNFGVDYLLTLKKINLFGETAMNYNSNNTGFATLNGAVIDLVPEFKMSFLHRYYCPDYQALYAQPFSEGNKPSNESGIFIGVEISPKKNWRIDLYVDSWRYSWLRYGVDGPSSGMEYVSKVSYFLEKNIDMYVRLKYETKKKNNSGTEIGVSPLIPYSTANIRYHINYATSSNLKFKNRVEVSNYNLDGSDQWGYMIYQDIQYIPSKIPFVFTIHVAVFDTESYDTRIYAYEPDVLYGFSIPAYYGRGTRLVFVLKYSILKNLDFWFRIANSHYRDMDGLGSWLDAIEGKNRTDIKLQLRFKF